MLLKTIQENFLNDFLNQSSDATFEKHIKPTEKLSGKERQNIYQESITECLAGALRESYPVCERLVGEAFFTAMAYRYIETTPSDTSNLFHYGKTFSAFVDVFDPAKSLPYLSDVCQLEWAWHTAYYAADDRPFDYSALEKLSEKEQQHIVFHLPKSASLLESSYPIDHIWEVNQENYAGNNTVYLDQGSIKLLVWRNGIDIRIDKLSNEVYLFLKVIDTQTSFAELCSQFIDSHPMIDIPELLAKTVKKGWITGFSSP